MTSRRHRADIARLDERVAQSARRYNYWLGGKDHFAADRASGDAIARLFPGITTTAAENHRFGQRAVHHLATRYGIDQFLDIGCGLPTPGHTHHIAQTINPATRVVYVDNDPLVMVHARALLTGTFEGRIGYLHADLRHPRAILRADELTDTLDLTRPVALLLLAVLHYLPDPHAYPSVSTLMDALAPGSILVVSHATYDLLNPETRTALTGADFPGKADLTIRTHARIGRFFTGLRLLDPGLRVASRWRPDPGVRRTPDDQVAVLGGAAIKLGDGPLNPANPQGADRRTPYPSRVT